MVGKKNSNIGISMHLFSGLMYLCMLIVGGQTIATLLHEELYEEPKILYLKYYM
jgi:hypothetical protein